MPSSRSFARVRAARSPGLRSGLAALLLLAAAAPAHAGPYGDVLARCMNERMSDADRVVMIKWFYGALGAHPEVRELAPIDEKKFAPVSKAMGELVQRLMVQDCRTETAAAVKNEGMSSIESAFSAVGQFAARGLLTNAAVIDRISDYAKHVDSAAIGRALLGGDEGAKAAPDAARGGTGTADR